MYSTVIFFFAEFFMLIKFFQSKIHKLLLPTYVVIFVRTIYLCSVDLPNTSNVTENLIFTPSKHYGINVLFANNYT